MKIKNLFLTALIFSSTAFSKSADELYEEAASLFSFNELTKAEALMKQACEANSDKACVYLGKGYFIGERLAKDDKLAENFLQKACDNKFGEGCFELANLYDSLSKVLEPDNPQRKEYWAKRQALRHQSCELNYQRGCVIVKKSQIFNVVYNLDKYVREALDKAIAEGKKPILGSEIKNPQELALNILNSEGKMNSDWDYVDKVELLGSFKKGSESGIEVVMGNLAEPEIHGLTINFKRDLYGYWTCKINPAKAQNWTNSLMPEQRQLRAICTVSSVQP